MSVFFLFKQKTAYEMRISDWSSDVCSSDLLGGANGYKSAGLREPTQPTACVTSLFLRRDPGVDMPLQHIQRYRAGFQHGVVVGPQVELRPQLAGGLLTESGDLELADLVGQRLPRRADVRSEEHTSELQSLMRISYAVFCLKKKKTAIIQILNI